MSAAPQVRTLVQYPLNTASPAVFKQEAYAYTADFALFNTELQALVNWMNANIGYSFPQNYSDASYDLHGSDVNKYLRFTNISAKTINVRPNTTEAMPQGATWTFRNANSSNVTLAEGAGVTINPPAGGTLVFEPGAVVSLIRVAVDEYDLLGQTVAA